MTNTMFIYHIDSKDTIVRVSDNWMTFAEDNQWNGLVAPQDVVGENLFRFIRGAPTQHFYKDLFRKARRGLHVRPVRFRCDSPHQRRFCELSISLAEDETLELRSTILRIEACVPRSRCDKPNQSALKRVVICSLCLKIKVSSKQWMDMEEAMETFNFHTAHDMSQVIYDVCPSCCSEASVQPASSMGVLTW